MTKILRQKKFRLVLLCGIFVLLQGCSEAIVLGGMGGLIAYHDARTTKHWYQDQAIEKDARRLLRDDSRIDGHADINVVSYNRRVLLTGIVQTKSLKDYAEKRVAGVKNVRKVLNELVVASKNNNASGGDGMMATRIKAKLFFNDFDATRVKVISASGHVYLMGLVSHAESDQVVAMLHDINGVHEISKMFEYVD